MIYPKKNEKYPMMSHDVSLYPIKSQNCHGCYPEIAALGWVVPSRTILGMNFRFSGDNGEIRKKHGNIFDGILSMVYINGMLMVYIYISFGMWFGNINERLIWKKIRFGTWFGNNEIFEGSSWDLTRSFMVLAVHGWKFSPDWLGLCIAKFDGRR